MLLDADADPGILDDRFGATALGWAEHGGHPAFADLIRTHTSVRPSTQ
jgi:hypothetical protein